jgi:hypothetical protein
MGARACALAPQRSTSSNVYWWTARRPTSSALQVSRSEPKASEDHRVVSRSEPKASEGHRVGSEAEPSEEE